MSRFGFILVCCCSYLVFAACIDRNHGPRVREDIYFDFKVWGEEGNDSVTVVLQFREGGPYGASIPLESPSMIKLDDVPLPEDNSSLTGPIYTITKDLKSFTGKHRIIFIDGEGQKFTEEFSYKPFILLTKIPDTIPAKKFILAFSGLNPQDYLRFLLTDTSFTGDGVNRIDTVYNNQSFLSRTDLNSLEPGPVQFECIRESERILRYRGEEAGLLSVTYTLRREFFLKEN